MSQMAELTQAARQCAALFRLGRDVEGALEMVDLFAVLMPLFSAGAGERQQQWLQILQAMLKCQEQRDNLGLADYLEYELVALLQSAV